MKRHTPRFVASLNACRRSSCLRRPHSPWNSNCHHASLNKTLIQRQHLSRKRFGTSGAHLACGSLWHLSKTRCGAKVLRDAKRMPGHCRRLLRLWSGGVRGVLFRRNISDRKAGVAWWDFVELLRVWNLDVHRQPSDAQFLGPASRGRGEKNCRHAMDLSPWRATTLEPTDQGPVCRGLNLAIGQRERCPEM